MTPTNPEGEAREPTCPSCNLERPTRGSDDPDSPTLCWAEYDLRSKIACRERTIVRLGSALSARDAELREVKGQLRELELDPVIAGRIEVMRLAKGARHG